MCLHLKVFKHLNVCVVGSPVEHHGRRFGQQKEPVKNEISEMPMSLLPEVDDESWNACLGGAVSSQYSLRLIKMSRVNIWVQATNCELIDMNTKHLLEYRWIHYHHLIMFMKSGLELLSTSSILPGIISGAFVMSKYIHGMISGLFVIRQHRAWYDFRILYICMKCISWVDFRRVVYFYSRELLAG